jgi:hypothetical protein
MQKSWYILSECQQKDEYTDEYNEKMEFYEKICAHKKPYFFGYNYSSLMREYKETTNRAVTNARQKFRMELEEILAMYENNEPLQEEQRTFVERFLHSLKLDRSKSTCNMICWEIESIFDGKTGFACDKVDLYSLVRSNDECSPTLLDKITKLCKKSEQKRAIKCAIGFILNKEVFEYDEEYSNVDYNMTDILSEVCNNEEQLCDLLLDYCYKYNGNKEILWNVCGETIFNRLAQGKSLYYPSLDPNGDFEVQGKKYVMREYVFGGDKDEV